MSNVETISNVPLDLIGPLRKHPEMDVKLSRVPTVGDSFMGNAPLRHEFSWVHTDVEPLKPIPPRDRDWSRGIQSYTVRLPKSDVYLPAKPSFAYDDELGWTCELGADTIEGKVSESIGWNGTPREELARTQDFKVRRRLVLDPGIAAFLREDRSEQSLPGVRTCHFSLRDASSFTGQ
jgi:hypothetical protein